MSTIGLTVGQLEVHRPALIKYMLSKVRCYNLAEDLVQDAYVSVHTSKRPIESPQFLYRAAHRRLLDHQKKNKYVDEFGDYSLVAAPCCFADLEVKLSVLQLLKLDEQLQPVHKDIFFLTSLGYTPSEIYKMGVTKQNLSYIKRVLRNKKHLVRSALNESFNSR